MMACAIVRSLTMRRLTKTFCGPRVRPLLAERRDVTVDRHAARLLAHRDQVGALAVHLVEALAAAPPPAGTRSTAGRRWSA